MLWRDVLTAWDVTQRDKWHTLSAYEHQNCHSLCYPYSITDHIPTNEPTLVRKKIGGKILGLKIAHFQIQRIDDGVVVLVVA